MGNSTTKKGNFVAIIAMIFLFAMIAFVTNLCSPMAVILKNNFSVSDTLAQVGNYGNFGAYFLMGIPAGLLIQKFGYKKTALLALIVGIVGLLIQWLSGSMGFVVYLIGAFISGLCMCMLNTVVNPMLNLLGGGGNTGNQLVQIGGVFNSAAAVCVYILMGALIGDASTAKVSAAIPALMIALPIFSSQRFRSQNSLRPTHWQTTNIAASHSVTSNLVCLQLQSMVLWRFVLQHTSLLTLLQLRMQ